MSMQVEAPPNESTASPVDGSKRCTPLLPEVHGHSLRGSSTNVLQRVPTPFGGSTGIARLGDVAPASTRVTSPPEEDGSFPRNQQLPSFPAATEASDGLPKAITTPASKLVASHCAVAASQ